MTPWYGKPVRDAKRIIFDHPPVFREVWVFIPPGSNTGGRESPVNLRNDILHGVAR